MKRMRNASLGSTLRRVVGMILCLPCVVIAAPITTIHFDNLPEDTVVSTQNGVSFTYLPIDPLASGYPLVVATGYQTSSNKNYLGVQDGRAHSFQSGDRVKLAFSSPIYQLDVTFIAPAGTPDQAFGLLLEPYNVVNFSWRTDMYVLATGDEAFTVHLAWQTPLTEATLISRVGTAPMFSIDDIRFQNTPAVSIDVDSSAVFNGYFAYSDGVLIARYLFGLTGSALTNDALGQTAGRRDPVLIKAYLDGIRASLDVDGDGKADALSDGVLILRYLLGLRGSSLVNGVINPLASRKTAPEIEAYLRFLTP
jgi:hypothetical protein